MQGRMTSSISLVKYDMEDKIHKLTICYLQFRHHIRNKMFSSWSNHHERPSLIFISMLKPNLCESSIMFAAIHSLHLLSLVAYVCVRFMLCLCLIDISSNRKKKNHLEASLELICTQSHKTKIIDKDWILYTCHE